jgi:CHRD domain-containing protein
MMTRVGTGIVATVVLAATVACASDKATSPNEVRVPLFERSGGGNILGTHLDGDNESPPRATQAQGQAIFRISDDGESVTYTLIAANIDNPFMAHIHLAAPGVNGPIVEWLFPSTAPVAGPTGIGRFDGVLASGTFTASNLVGPLAHHPLSDLIAAMRSGGAYVNVHTDDGVAPSNTGPGDFPGGEIRGQLSTPGKP